MARLEDDPNRGAANPTPQPEDPLVEKERPIQSASEYARRTRERQAALEQSKVQRRPLGGAPPIPAGKMAAIAVPQPDFGEPEEYQAPERPILPPQDAPQPSHIPGVGSGYSVNQAMARGELDKPMSLSTARKEMGGQKKQGPLSPETVELLKMQAKQPSQEAPSQPQGPAPDESRQKLADSEEEIAEDNRIDLTDLPLDAIAAIRNDLIYNDRRRKEIEGRLQPLDISDLITKREIQQDVPVVPNKLIYTFRTMNEQELLFCMQYVYEFPGSARYVEELLNMARIVCGIVALNGRMLPDHRNNVSKLNEEVDRKAFEKKFKLVTLYPTNLVADMGANLHWFVERVNKLFSAETLKNG